MNAIERRLGKYQIAKNYLVIQHDPPNGPWERLAKFECLSDDAERIVARLNSHASLVAVAKAVLDRGVGARWIDNKTGETNDLQAMARAALTEQQE